MPDAKEHFGYCNCDACRVKRLERTELRLLDELKTIRQQLAGREDRVKALEEENARMREIEEQRAAECRQLFQRIDRTEARGAALEAELKEEREKHEPETAAAGPTGQTGDGGPGD